MPTPNKEDNNFGSRISEICGNRNGTMVQHIPSVVTIPFVLSSFYFASSKILNSIEASFNSLMSVSEIDSILFDFITSLTLSP